MEDSSFQVDDALISVRRNVVQVTGAITPILMHNLIESLDRVASNARRRRKGDNEGKPTVVLEINSEGGDAFSSLAVADVIAEMQSKVRVNTKAVGMCASGATLIYLAGAERTATRHTMFMIHQLNGIIDGSYDQMAAGVMLNNHLHKSIVDYYVSRTLLSKEMLESKLRATTWFDVTQATSWGFVTGKLIIP